MTTPRVRVPVLGAMMRSGPRAVLALLVAAAAAGAAGAQDVTRSREVARLDFVGVPLGNFRTPASRVVLTATSTGVVHIEAWMSTATASATMRGDDVREWLDSANVVARFAEPVGSEETVTIKTPPSQQLALLRTIKGSMSQFHLLFRSAQPGTFVLILADSEVRRLLGALATADSVMRSMSPPIPLRAHGTAGGPFGVAASTAPANADRPYFEFQVEKPVRTTSGSPQPAYPPDLKAARIEGEVLAQFVVGTDGMARIATLKILRSSHDGFSEAIRKTLPLMLFHPAEVGGRKVPQIVQQPFTFALSP